jgi:hypothetical protein
MVIDMTHILATELLNLTLPLWEQAGRWEQIQNPSIGVLPTHKRSYRHGNIGFTEPNLIG